MRLVWYQRDDGLWNAECACHATIAGVPDEARSDAEVWHFRRAQEDRKQRPRLPACGPKLPEPNPNFPDPFVFP